MEESSELSGSLNNVAVQTFGRVSPSTYAERKNSKTRTSFRLSWLILCPKEKRSILQAGVCLRLKILNTYLSIEYLLGSSHSPRCERGIKKKDISS